MALHLAAGSATPWRRTISHGRAGGFTYLVILLAVALFGIALAATGTVWTTAVQRDREAELIFVGGEIRKAIESYYRQSPGVAQYPRELEELIEDRRFPFEQRHLRRIYVDPMTGRLDWVLIRNEGGALIGVRSSSDATPIKRANFDAAESAFEGAECYCDWKFVFTPTLVARTPRKG